MKRYSLEFIGRVNSRPTFSKTKKVEIIIYKSLKDKKILKRGVISMPYHASYYDYTCELQRLFLVTLKIKPYVSRETLKKSKTFVYHIYLITF